MVKGSKQYNSLRVVIAGGGTGGHIFPALAIASALKKKAFDARILFVGAKGKMEMRVVPEAGFHIIGLDIAGLQRSLSVKNLVLPLKVIRSLSAAKNIIKRFKPDLAIGVGGYASGPVIWAAAQQSVPVLIQEQNAYPGLTNRILGKKADKICVAFEGMEKYLPAQKLFLTGNPVREEVVNIDGKRKDALNFFGFDHNRPVLFVTGGSLGALSINESIARHMDELLGKGLQVIWQTGTSYFKQASAIKNQLGEPASIYVSEFIRRMDYAYAAADVVVSRAGAIAVSELCVIRKPAILVPSPNVAEDHQAKNAITLVNHHAAVMVKDQAVREKLGEAIIALIFDEDKQQKLKEKMAGLSYRNAADVIADVALSMI